MHLKKKQAMKQTVIALLALIILAACNSTEQKTAPSESSFPLQAYVEAPDEAFRYEISETVRGESWTD